ncbi:hypothetical protein SeMB42_g06425 [Synchytrium endobioticum]|uniref:Uncharacterized protein n=1 Tax=Synchytrium endobioticum TaxID=286115 RepID=A0A507CIF1_9FUNG|nr:hypothetical protein SeMB42_g06425 [Synchytrium endobioticum]TPX40214.1 hypothetical protein SeLEV6574_g06734 [Synchytrium endobioticum]
MVYLANAYSVLCSVPSRLFSGITLMLLAGFFSSFDAWPSGCRTTAKVTQVRNSIKQALTPKPHQSNSNKMPTTDYIASLRATKRKGTPLSFGPSSEYPPPTLPRRSRQTPPTPPRTPTFGRARDTSDRDTGIQQQLKILAALEALREGKLPSNDQLLKLIDALENAPFLQHNRHKLSGDGKKAMHDAETLAETLKRVVLEKNQNENLQHFIYHARTAAMATSADGGGISAPALADIRKGFSSMYNLGRLLLTNEEFRDLLSEFSSMLQDIFVGSAVRITGRGSHADGDEGLEGSRKRSRTPSRARRTPAKPTSESTAATVGTRTTVKPGPVPQSMTVIGEEPFAIPVTVHGQSAPSDSHQLQQEQQQQQSGERVQPAAATTATAAAEGETGGPSSDVQSNKFSVKSLASKMKGAVRDESSTGGNVVSAIAESIQDLPDEQLSDIMDKFKRVMHEIQGYPEYQDAIGYLIELARELGQVGYYAADALRRGSRSSVVDPNVRQAQQELFQLVENFASGVELQPLFDHLYNLRSAMSTDRELRGLAHDGARFMERSLKEPDYIGDPDYAYFGSQLINRARRVLLEKYQEDTYGSIESGQRVLDGFASDELTREFGRDVRILTQDLFLNEQGRVTIKTSLVNDVFSVIFPMMIEQIRYLPIPRIEHLDENYHVIVENIVLASENFLPNYMEIKLKNAALIPLRRHETTSLSHGFTMNLYQIQAHMEDMPFYFRRKSFPSITDCGVCDVHLSGQGITVMVKMAIDQYSESRTLVPRRIRCFVDQLDLSIHNSQHDTLYRALSPVLNTVLKTQIASAIENQVFDIIHSLDSSVTEWKVKYLLTQPASDEEATSRRPLSRFLSSAIGGGGTQRHSGFSLKGHPKRAPSLKARGSRGPGAAWSTNRFD